MHQHQGRDRIESGIAALENCQHGVGQGIRVDQLAFGIVADV
jgi:hypothetical protein